MAFQFYHRIFSETLEESIEMMGANIAIQGDECFLENLMVYAGMQVMADGLCALS
ncbi:hypothetical protein XFHB_13245 [Xylella fastidiosa]|uniref:Uncharacterized protein n=1 Tax=Xylella fastidiosa TaxID=2371 RepID=A0ABD7BYC4_XYLFS|nr:hypothetical protein [Xylella fastidiosa]QPB72630.1 hypothetical protein XFHB_13245 [Xylella fastidiosa]